jgi:hypothetical protein
VASWILTPPADLPGDDRVALAQITARCEEPKATRDLVREFAEMLCHRRGERLEAWASQAETSPVSELRGFSKGLRKDWAAVTAGLTVSYSSGAVEGNVNRIILWNKFVRFCPVLPWRTPMTGSSLPTPGPASWRGVGPAGVGVSASLPRRLSIAACPSSMAACSPSVSGIAAVIFCRLVLASSNWAFAESFGV